MQQLEGEGKDVVGSDHKRTAEGCQDSPGVAEGIKQGRRHRRARRTCHDGQGKQPVADPVMAGLPALVLFPPDLPGKIREEILQGSQRTDRRAVNPAEQQCEEEDRDESRCRQAGKIDELQQGGEELQVGHARHERGRYESRKVKKQQGGQAEEDQRHCNPPPLQTLHHTPC